MWNRDRANTVEPRTFREMDFSNCTFSEAMINWLTMSLLFRGFTVIDWSRVAYE